MRPPQAGERPNGRRGQCREAKPAERAPAPEASNDVPTDAARIIGIYRRHAAAYAAARGQDLFERAWLDRFLALLPPRAAVLDIGCGFGAPIAAHLIAQGHAVTGLDTSAPLLAMARARFPDHAWIEGDMRDLALGRRFDGLLAWDSFFHLGHDDQRRMFPTFAAHAAPGAALMFTAGPAHGTAMPELDSGAEHTRNRSP